MEIRELHTEEEFLAAFPVMQELTSGLTPERYMKYLREMQDQGYRLFALMEGASYISLAGILVLTNFYDGRHLWVHDLVTSSPYRSRGYGKRLLAYVENLAGDLSCEKVVLPSSVRRVDAHRFYEEKMGYSRFGYVFKKELKISKDLAQ